MVTRAPPEFAAWLADLRNTEALHPLLTGVTLEREDGRTRVWRCDDRIFGVPLTYFAHQTLDADGLGFVTRTDQSGLQLTNTWRFAAHTDGTLVTEQLRFEGRPWSVAFAAPIGTRAHRGLFAAIAAKYGVR